MFAVPEHSAAVNNEMVSGPSTLGRGKILHQLTYRAAGGKPARYMTGEWDSAYWVGNRLYLKRNDSHVTTDGFQAACKVSIYTSNAVPRDL